MKNLIIFTTVFVLFLVFILPGLVALPIKMIPFADQPGYSTDYKVAIYSRLKVFQRFVSQGDNLTAIGMTLGNPNLKNNKQIIFTLYDKEGAEIRKSILNGINIADGAFVKFVFDPVMESKDREFVYSIETPSAGAEEVLNVFFTKSKPDWISNMEIDRQVYEGGMPMVTFHKPKSRLAMITSIYLDLLKRLVGRSN